MSLLAAALAFAVDVALGTWLGAMVFFSFVAAPRVFAVLDDRAGDVVNDIFPRYYVFGIALGIVAGVAALAAGLRSGFDPATLAVLGAVGVAVLLTAYARWGLIPAMEAADEDAFERYHRRSVILNGLAMLAVVVALVAAHAP